MKQRRSCPSFETNAMDLVSSLLLSRSYDGEAMLMFFSMRELGVLEKLPALSLTVLTQAFFQKDQADRQKKAESFSCCYLVG